VGINAVWTCGEAPTFRQNVPPKRPCLHKSARTVNALKADIDIHRHGNFGNCISLKNYSSVSNGGRIFLAHTFLKLTLL
jgi:hypothetical protein